VEGKFSTQYCQAVAALTGGLGLGDFDDEAVVHPDRQGMMRRVELQVAPDAATWPGAEDPTGSQAARVEVELEDGAVYRTFTPIPRGYPGLQPSDADLEVKFLNCAGRGLGPAAARSLADQLLRLEACGDVAPIAEQVWTGEVA
jgi:2-methylcitrate dehydratase PrpD